MQPKLSSEEKIQSISSEAEVKEKPKQLPSRYEAAAAARCHRGSGEVGSVSHPYKSPR